MHAQARDARAMKHLHARVAHRVHLTERQYLRGDAVERDDTCTCADKLMCRNEQNLLSHPVTKRSVTEEIERLQFCDYVLQ